MSNLKFLIEFKIKLNTPDEYLKNHITVRLNIPSKEHQLDFQNNVIK
jgi:hypothetical protein